MSAVLVLSPTPTKIFIGQGFTLRGQIRDSETHRPYDLTGNGGMVGKLVSLTGGTARTLAVPPTVESAPNATVIISGSNADTSALAAGRWYIQLQVAGVPNEGNGATIQPDLVPFDAVASQ